MMDGRIDIQRPFPAAFGHIKLTFLILFSTLTMKIFLYMKYKNVVLSQNWLNNLVYVPFLGV